MDIYARAHELQQAQKRDPMQKIYATDGPLLATLPTSQALVYLRNHAGPNAFLTVGGGRINVYRGEAAYRSSQGKPVAYAVRADSEEVGR